MCSVFSSRKRYVTMVVENIPVYISKIRKIQEKMNGEKKDPYMQEAYDMLEQMSADERKRLEYEAREKAIRDYNTQMYSVRKQGITDIILLR